jgi:hypothetical protein
MALASSSTQPKWNGGTVAFFVVPPAFTEVSVSALLAVGTVPGAGSNHIVTSALVAAKSI